MSMICLWGSNSDVDDLDDELHLRHRVTQRARQPRPRVAPVANSTKRVLLVHIGHDAEQTREKTHGEV